MKKYDLLKVLGITFLVIALISWVVPAGVYSSGSFVSLEEIAPIGLYDLFKTPLITIATFIQYGVLFLAIGGFYGVLNKTGVYAKLVDRITDKWQKNSKKFLMITVAIFALLSSLLGLNSVIFILVPFFAAILLKLGYKKITALASTVGAMLIGQIGCTLGLETWGYLRIVFSQMGYDITMTSLILVRIILLLITVTLFALLLSKSTKNETKKKDDEVEIPLLEENTSKKGYIPLVILGLLTILLLFVGVYNWYYTFDIDVFANLYEKVMLFEVNGHTLFDNLLGNVSIIGYWGNYDIAVLLIIASLVISWVYSVKMTEAIDSFAKGMKEMLAPALYGMLASIIFAVFLNMSSNFIYTIVNQFTESGEFSLTGVLGSALVTSFTYNDFPTLVSSFMDFFSLYDTNVIPVVALIFQAIYGLVMVIAPTSIFLLVGLSYFKVSYKEWFSYIWKFALAMLGIIIVIGFIATMLV